MDKIDIFDTTLRDGEQSPGASMSLEQKIEIGQQLAHMGVDIIEAGFPVSSPIQFEACKTIAKEVKGPTIAVLSRTLKKDLDAAYEAVKGAEKSRIHTFIASSPIHMEYKLKKSPEEVLEMAEFAVKYARNLVPEVEFSPEDATRSEMSFLCRLIEKAIAAGASVINIPDTVGYSIPEEFGNFIKTIRENVSNIDKAVISVHCHNDLGLGVANTLMGVINGARQVEVTINGIGERAGNAALEEFIMQLYVRKDILPFKTNINEKQIYNASRLVSNIIGFPIPRTKPITGDNAFSHEAGIHQDGILKHRQTYEIMTPESVGREATQIVLGRHSGKHGFTKRLKELGLKLSEEDITTAYEAFLKVADKKKEVYDDDLFVIISDSLGHDSDTFILEYFNIISGNTSVPTATVRIRLGKEIKEEAATGDGPVDAIFNSIDRILGIKAKLHEYLVQAVTPGREAMGEVTISLIIHNRKYVGRGSSTDILEASAKAYVSAMNQYKNLNNNKNK
jgi:2-isopropylmalate synthase